MAVYAITRPMGQKLAQNIIEVVAQLDAIADETSGAVNEVHKLKDRVSALPLELLRSQRVQGQADEHYRDTAILCIALKHLPGYVDTLDEQRIQSYVDLLHLSLIHI